MWKKIFKKNSHDIKLFVIYENLYFNIVKSIEIIVKILYYIIINYFVILSKIIF